MNSDINTPSFHRTGKTWAWLLVATLLWVVTCLWAFDYAGYSLVSFRSESSETSIAKNQNAAAPAEEQARLVAAAEEAVRLDEESRQVAAAEEVARLDEEARQIAAAEEVARLEEEARRFAAAEEAARLEEEARQVVAAEEAARLEDEARRIAAAEEAARVEEEARRVAAAEAARVEEEAREVAAAEEAGRIAAAEEAASAAALTEAARVAELLVQQNNEKSRADDAARQRAEQQNIDVQARQLAANEAARVAAVARRLREFEELRAQELLVLPVLSAQTQFLTRNSAITRDLERTLDRMFDPLYLYSELPVVVAVASNDGDQTADNDDLSNGRARAIVDYLVNRGLERGRFRIQTEAVGGMPVGTHRVRVFVLEDNQ